MAKSVSHSTVMKLAAILEQKYGQKHDLSSLQNKNTQRKYDQKHVHHSRTKIRKENTNKNMFITLEQKYAKKIRTKHVHHSRTKIRKENTNKNMFITLEQKYTKKI